MSSSIPPPSPPPYPHPHPECTSRRHQWIQSTFELPAAGQAQSAWEECENRPWANLDNRTQTGCIGQDFVLHNPRVHFRFFWNNAERKLGGAVHWDSDAEGPPKGAHGASICLVFDEILAYPVWRSGLAAFTANLNINLKKMIPLGSTQRFEAMITKKEGRKIFVEGRIMSSNGLTTYAEAKGLWIESRYLAKIGDTRPRDEEQTNNNQSPQVQIQAKL